MEAADLNEFVQRCHQELRARLYQSGLLGSADNWSKDSAYKFTIALSDAIINETPHPKLAEYIELQQTPFCAAESLLWAYARKIAEILDEYDFRSELGRQLAAIKRAARQLHRKGYSNPNAELIR